MDDTTDENREIGSYYISDARASYGLAALGMKRISFNAAGYNLFNKMYEANDGGIKEVEITLKQTFYYPQAGTHFMAEFRIDL